jgi:FAD/FMN-containing dehydrogenase
MGAFCMEAGLTLGQFYKKMYQRTGKTLPGGSWSTVALGGHVTGGGFGLLSRQHGLTVDYLYAVEVAVVDRTGTVELVTATRDDDDPDLKDLWWAARHRARHHHAGRHARRGRYRGQPDRRPFRRAGRHGRHRGGAQVHDRHAAGGLARGQAADQAARRRSSSASTRTR